MERNTYIIEDESGEVGRKKPEENLLAEINELLSKDKKLLRITYQYIKGYMSKN